MNTNTTTFNESHKLELAHDMDRARKTAQGEIRQQHMSSLKVSIRRSSHHNASKPKHTRSDPSFAKAKPQAYPQDNRSQVERIEVKRNESTFEHGRFLQLVMIDSPPRKPQRRPSLGDGQSPASLDDADMAMCDSKYECAHQDDRSVATIDSQTGDSVDTSSVSSTVVGDDDDDDDVSEASLCFRNLEDDLAANFIAKFEQSSLPSPSPASRPFVDSISLDSISSAFDLKEIRENKNVFATLLGKVRGKKRNVLV